ncbi:hypothetical protein ACROYT_G002883 [Oculina patagonica]
MSSFSRISVKAETCEAVEFTSDKCRSADYITVLNQRVHKGETKRIKLPSDSETQIRWYCGSSEERTAWNKPANQVRVMYQNDGSIRWSIYKCADLSGPKKAGENCAVPETTEFCPKFGANSSACVFELKKSTSNVNQKTTTVSIEGTLRAEVEKKAGPLTAKGSAEVKGGVSHSVTKAKIVTYESRSFLVIPPGFSFCAFTNNTSVPDVNSPTGFRWRCSFPEYIKAEEKFSNGRCTSLEICDVGVCGRTEAVDSGVADN